MDCHYHICSHLGCCIPLTRSMHQGYPSIAPYFLLFYGGIYITIQNSSIWGQLPVVDRNWISSTTFCFMLPIIRRPWRRLRSYSLGQVLWFLCWCCPTITFGVDEGFNLLLLLMSTCLVRDWSISIVDDLPGLLGKIILSCSLVSKHLVRPLSYRLLVGIMTHFLMKPLSCDSVFPTFYI